MNNNDYIRLNQGGSGPPRQPRQPMGYNIQNPNGAAQTPTMCNNGYNNLMRAGQAGGVPLQSPMGYSIQNLNGSVQSPSMNNNSYNNLMQSGQAGGAPPQPPVRYNLQNPNFLSDQDIMARINTMPRMPQNQPASRRIFHQQFARLQAQNAAQQVPEVDEAGYMTNQPA